MNKNARDFALFIDGLRIEKKISRENLCEGIISLSQYKRYLRGDTSMPNNVVGDLADKLKFSINDLHLIYRNKSDNQYNKINEIYHFMVSNQLDEAYAIAKDFTDKHIVSSSNQLFFDFCMISIQHELQLISDIQVLEMFSGLIDYPECMENDSHSWIEINILMQIVQITAKMENYEPTNHMYTLLKQENFIKSYTGEGGMIPGIYATIAKILGRQEKDHEVVEICQIGIDYCVHHEISSSLSHLLFFKSFSLHNLGELDYALEESKKGFMQLYLEDKPDKFEIFRNIFERRFEMNLDDFIDFAF